MEKFGFYKYIKSTLELSKCMLLSNIQSWKRKKSVHRNISKILVKICIDGFVYPVEYMTGKVYININE